ncbi:MAG: hypothetical protein PHU27_11710, partial [Salinivirgaceae bacterium]|nr:hypothetical protein [Salinivirgaceae bacterium]
KRKQVQIFGTQYFRTRSKDTVTRKDTWSDMELYPIADEENVNRRRKAIGLESIEEFCFQRKVQYIPIKERLDSKPIKIKRRWKRKGYLLGTSPQK